MLFSIRIEKPDKDQVDFAVKRSFRNILMGFSLLHPKKSTSLAGNPNLGTVTASGRCCLDLSDKRRLWIVRILIGRTSAPGSSYVV